MTSLTVTEASKVLNTPEVTIRRWCRDGKLGAEKNDDGNYLIKKREVVRQLLNVVCVFNQMIQRG